MLVDLAHCPPTTIAGHRYAIPQELRQAVLSAFSKDSLQNVLQLDGQMAHLFSDAVHAVLDKSRAKASEIQAIGSHGQTISHQPSGAYPHSLQIGDPNVIAQRTGITTVADFRRRDMAGRWTGRPTGPGLSCDAVRAKETLASSFEHRRHCQPVIVIARREPSRDRVRYRTGRVTACSMRGCRSSWRRPSTKMAIGLGAARLTQNCLSGCWPTTILVWHRPRVPGRSTLVWTGLEGALLKLSSPPSPQDVQRTLVELTVKSISEALIANQPGCEELLVCGGGVHNPLIMDGLQQELSRAEVKSTSAYGVDPDYLEATAFAWLAKQTLEGKPGNLASVTGAASPVILGGVYYANPRRPKPLNRERRATSTSGDRIRIIDHEPGPH